MESKKLWMKMKSFKLIGKLPKSKRKEFWLYKFLTGNLKTQRVRFWCLKSWDFEVAEEWEKERSMGDNFLNGESSYYHESCRTAKKGFFPRQERLSDYVISIHEPPGVCFGEEDGWN